MCQLAAAAALGLLAHSASASEAAAVQVVLARVERNDLPVEPRAIGTAQAYNTVMVKPLVGGQIVQVAFTEGQRVHRGTALVRIDERPLTARLHEAQATQTKDAAQLQNLRVDLARLTTLAAKGMAIDDDIEARWR